MGGRPETIQYNPRLLIENPFTGTNVRPPILLFGTGNKELNNGIKNNLLSLYIEYNGLDSKQKESLALDLFNYPITRYPDQEVKVKIFPECTDRHIFILQTPFPDQDKRLMEVFLMIDAARRAGAREITVILPYYAYGRKDRKEEARTPISSAVVSHILTSLGADRIITLDLHAEQTQGSVLNPWDNLYTSKLFIPEIKKLINPFNTIFVSPDTGGVPRVKAYKKRMGGRGIGFIIKERDIDEHSSKPEALLFVGDAKERETVIIDDEAVSLNSFSNAVWAVANNGAKKIIGVVTHFKYSEDSSEKEVLLKNLNSLPNSFQKLLTTDSIELPDMIKHHPLIKVIDSAPFWAEVIWRTFFGVRLNPDLID